MSRQRADGEERIDIDEYLPLFSVYIVKKTQVTDKEISDGHFIAERKLKMKSITEKPNEDLTRVRETSVSMLQTTERKSTKGEAPTIDEVIVEQTKNANYCGDRRLIGMNGSALLLDHKGTLFQA